MIHVVELCELADLHCAFRGRELADDGFQHRGLAETIPSTNADALTVLKSVVEPAEQFLSTQRHAEIAHLHRAIAQLRRRRDAKFHILLDCWPVLRRFVVVTLEPILLFAALRSRALAHPRQFFFQKHLALVLDGRVRFLTFRFGQQVIGVVTVLRPELSFVQLHHPLRHTVEKVAIMCYHKKRTVKLIEKIRDPINGFRIEMVRGFVENEKVGQ